MQRRILICDDEFCIVAPLALKFDKAGYDVATAMDGEEAWQMVQEQKPDLLIADIRMPRLDGFGLVERIRKDPATHDIPIIFLTAAATDPTVEQTAKSLGVSKVIPKPYAFSEVLASAEHLFEQDASRYAAPAV